MKNKKVDLAHDLVLPTLLFAALGGMTWAVRGCSGFGAVPGCLFAGVTWGAAWWFIAQGPGGQPTRRYTSGWIVPALTFGIGLAGNRGWMQWPSFFEGRLMTDYEHGEFVPIAPAYGFLWLFIAGVPWAGLGACFLAWCGSQRETRVWHWVLRIGCGFGGAVLAKYLFNSFPQVFLPLYESLEARYHDPQANPSLLRLITDNGNAMVHVGFYLGFLLYEVLRFDWKNVVLILTVGLINGAGWALCQNWKWAVRVWGDGSFNFWRCWESSGGISIGIAYGIAYFLVNREMSDEEQRIVASRRALAGPNFEWLLVFSGLAASLSLFTYSALGRKWNRLDFTVLLLFAAAYYFCHRGTLMAGASEERRSAITPKVEWGAVGVTAALIAVLFIGTRGIVNIASSADLYVPEQWIIPLKMVCIGVVMAAGIAWYWLRRPDFDNEKELTTPRGGDPNLERLGLYLGLLAGLGLSLRNGLKGWFNIYLGHEDDWNRVLWHVFGPALLVCLIALAAWILFRPIPRDFRGDLFPHAYGLIWLVLLWQNAIAQLVTGPPTVWREMAFSIYYVLLFAITAVIVFQFHERRRPPNQKLQFHHRGTEGTEQTTNN